MGERTLKEWMRGSSGEAKKVGEVAIALSAGQIGECNLA